MLAYIIGLLVAAGVFLAILWPPMSSLFKGAGTQSECNMNLLLAAGFKAGTLGFGEIPAACQASYTTVDANTLEKADRVAKKRIDRYCGIAATTGTKALAGAAISTPETFYSAAAGEFCETGTPTYNDIAEWELDQIMAKKLLACSNKVFHGKLDIATRWPVKDRQICIVCDVVSFSNDLPITINKQVARASLYDWMQAESYFKKTYYDYTFEGFTKPKKAGLAYTTKIPVAIVYTEQKASWWSKLWRPIVVGAAWAVTGGVTAVTFGAAGPVAIGAASVVTGAVMGGVAAAAQEGEPVHKFLLLHPYELLQKESEKGGLGCTDIIA